ncbi:MAG: hypothetical protein ACMXYG_07340 [Candidatus Woesearchaeota archaeon]
MKKNILSDIEVYLLNEANRVSSEYGYEIVEKLPAANCAVYKIQKGNDFAVLKIMHSNIGNFLIDDVEYVFDVYGYFKALEIEAEIFKKLDGIEGLPRIYESVIPSNIQRKINETGFSSKVIEAYIIREYIEGIPVGRRNISSISHDYHIKNNPMLIVDTLKEIHHTIAGLDIIPPNIILNPNGPYLIDFVSPKTRRKLYSLPSQYEKLKQVDLRRLYDMIDKETRLSHSLI